MELSKVKLSEAEIQLAQNQDFILTKNVLIGKIYSLFGEISQVQQQQAAQYGLDKTAAFLAGPKISRGEKHDGFPWVILDYPRHFAEADWLAQRVFFWWGHYFTVSVVAKGKFGKRLAEGLESGPPPTPVNYWAGIPADIWNQSLPQPGLTQMPATSACRVRKLEKDEILKMAVCLPLPGWQQLAALATSWSKWLYGLMSP